MNINQKKREKKKSCRQGKKRGRPKKQQGVPFQGVDVVDRTGVEDPASDPQVEIYRSRIEAVVKGGKIRTLFR